MKKFTGIAVSSVLAATMIVGLASCGGGGNKTTSESVEEEVIEREVEVGDSVTAYVGKQSEKSFAEVVSDIARSAVGEGKFFTADFTAKVNLDPAESVTSSIEATCSVKGKANDDGTYDVDFGAVVPGSFRSDDVVLNGNFGFEAYLRADTVYTVSYFTDDEGNVYGDKDEYSEYSLSEIYSYVSGLLPFAANDEYEDYEDYEDYENYEMPDEGFGVALPVPGDVSFDFSGIDKYLSEGKDGQYLKFTFDFKDYANIPFGFITYLGSAPLSQIADSFTNGAYSMFAGIVKDAAAEEDCTVEDFYGNLLNSLSGGQIASVKSLCDMFEQTYPSSGISAYLDEHPEMLGKVAEIISSISEQLSEEQKEVLTEVSSKLIGYVFNLIYTEDYGYYEFASDLLGFKAEGEGGEKVDALASDDAFITKLVGIATSEGTIYDVIGDVIPELKELLNAVKTSTVSVDKLDGYLQVDFTETSVDVLLQTQGEASVTSGGTLPVKVSVKAKAEVKGSVKVVSTDPGLKKFY